MAVLEALEPKRVFYYFEEICKIPHGSYHEKEISDYLAGFAKSHRFSYWQDELYNIVMLIPASKGREAEKPIIMQGHMDMVCEKKPGATINMEQEGLELMCDDQYVFAKDTTLGGDDGIAIAYMLAIAENDEISHPPLEYIITVSEEVGMEGAAHIDLSMLKGSQMLNLDSEEEGVFLTSCAGGVSVHSKIPASRSMTQELNWYELTVSGLLGGHSGCEIDKERANANHVIGRVLYAINQRCELSLFSLEGGLKDNAIPLYAKAVIGMDKNVYAEVKQVVSEMQEILKTEYAGSDEGICVAIQDMELCEAKHAVEQDCLTNVIDALMILPNGVQAMSVSVKGLVRTSLNLGVMQLEQDHLRLQHAVRSSVTSEKRFLVDRIQCIIRNLGGSCEQKGDYPAWEYQEQSVVRPKAIALYEKMYGKTPKVEGIHAGLECGLLADKIANIDCISMGPDILDIHTPAERLDIASTKRVYEFLIAYLEEK